MANTSLDSPRSEAISTGSPVRFARAAACSAVSAASVSVAAESASASDAAEVATVDAGAGGAVFEAPQPVMWDSSGATATAGARGAAGSDPAGEPAAGESGKLAAVEVEVAQGSDQLVLTPDAQVLKGTDTVYPVFIDPQWYSPRATAWTFASKYWASSPQWKFNGENNAGDRRPRFRERPSRLRPGAAGAAPAPDSAPLRRT